MHDYPVSPGDFVPERLTDPRLMELAGRVSMVATNEVPRTATRLEAKLTDGSIVKTDVAHAFGSAGNPMDWKQLELKFQSLAEPALGDQAAKLFETLANFDRPGALKQLLTFTDKLEPIK
jgi:2-methylcitrate dehydratase PrpD